MTESLSPSIDSFLSMITVERGLARNTVEAYSRDLSRFAEFLIEEGILSWTAVEPVHIRSYLSALRRSGLSESSLARHVVTVRRFCHFLTVEGVIGDSPVPALRLRPPSRKLPHTLSADDIRLLLAQPDATKMRGSRDQAMLELLYATGLRVSELVSLRSQQIDFQGDYLTVKGKGGKVRAVPFGRWARE
jgi:integrase/recombinase XerD